MSLVMTPAKPEDLELLYAILVERSAWLSGKGIPQWNPIYPKTRFENELNAGRVYKFLAGEELVGTVTLLDVRPSYYPNDLWDDAISAWFICRLATLPQQSGKGYGDKIFRLIEAEASRRGVEALRLDVVKANPFLRSYYEKHGFVVIKEADSHGTHSLFMEKAINR